MNETELLIADWLDTAENLKQAKEHELYMRKLIIEKLEVSEAPGTYNIPIGPYKVKVTRGFRFNLDQSTCRDLMENGQLTAIEESCIRVKYELDKRAYDKLSEPLQNIDDMLTVTPSLPSMKVDT